MFIPRPKQKLLSKVKGLFTKGIPYVVRVPSGNWEAYFGKYAPQKFGQWDTDSCWCLSAVNSSEDQMEWLWMNDQFSQEAKDFFTSNGYIDSDGDFSLSERFHEILCGERDGGGTSPEAWQSFQKRGFIPRSQMSYTVEKSQSFNSQEEFDNDYFNLLAVTPAMIALGKKSLTYINISYQTIGKNWTTPDKQLLQTALLQAPLNIGIAIPINVFNWNNSFVQYDGATVVAHEIELYGLDDKGQRLIYDQYLPFCKTLSSDYPLPLVHQGVITSTSSPVIQPPKKTYTLMELIYLALAKYFGFNAVDPQVNPV